MNGQTFHKMSTSSIIKIRKEYMLGLDVICWAIWKTRNMVWFEKKMLANPINIIFFACAFIRYWAGLYSQETQRLIKDGVEVMMTTALKLIRKQENRKQVPTLEEKVIGTTEDEEKET
jgi:hypothetical protein